MLAQAASPVLLNVEQTALVVIGVATVVLFALQINAERFQVKPLSKANLKLRLHRIGLVAAILTLLVSIDPFGVRGVFPSWVGLIINANVSCLLVMGVAVMVERIFLVRYTTDMQPVPLWVPIYTWTLSALPFVAANVSYAYGVSIDRQWPVGIFEFVIIVVELALVFSFVIISIWVACQLSETADNLTIYQETGQTNPYAEVSSNSGSVSINANDPTSPRAGLKRSPSTTSNAAFDRDTTWLYVRAFGLLVLTLVVVPFQAMYGATSLVNKSDPLRKPVLDGFDGKDRAVLYINIVCLVSVLAYSWIPLLFNAEHRLSRQRTDWLSEKNLRRSPSANSVRQDSFSRSSKRNLGRDDSLGYGTRSRTGSNISATSLRIDEAFEAGFNETEPPEIGGDDDGDASRKPSVEQEAV